MKTKAQIVQRLLEEKKIDAEEAVILLQSSVEYIPYAAQSPYPVYPLVPYQPFWYVDPHPYITYCIDNTNCQPSLTFKVDHNGILN